jgi:hypothetical protein
VVLPTPPLPEPIATIFETPGNATGEGMAEECAIEFDCSFSQDACLLNRSKSVLWLKRACFSQIEGYGLQPIH